MKNVLLQAAIKLNQAYRRKRWWRWTVRTMAMLVVFCTTYILILPALTMETETVCGLEAHTHSQSCYTAHQHYEYVCGWDDQTKVIHIHDSFCYDDQGNLICLLPEIEGHTHEEGCYATENVLICTVHTHDDTCSAKEKVLICNVEESEAHAHGEDCYEERDVVCELPADDTHVHDEACYEAHETALCQLEETILHTHEQTCYDELDVLICQQEQVVEHQHTEVCRLAAGEPEAVLTCALAEHIHEDACYPVEESEDPEYLCGMGVHAHMEGCYDAEGTLVCTIPEHAHEAACIVEGLDLTADVETEEAWMQSVSGMMRRGYWPADVAAVAQTQLHYKESEKNVVLAENVLKGYTRYGAWYGEAYADWNALFAAFCLDYAGVENYPVKNGAADWVEALKEQDLYRTDDIYIPRPGDLIFIDLDQVPDPAEPIAEIADLVGIVAELTETTEEAPARIKLIAGDMEDRVSEVTLDADDVTVIGYGTMPFGERFWKTYQGEDFTVSVTLTADAQLPESVQLDVREILPDTQEYQQYYTQSLEALMNTGAMEETLDVSFARFFDIRFLVNGEEVEPAAPVSIEIVYSDTISVKEEEAGQVVHFAKDGVEVLLTDTSLTESQQQEDSLLDEIAEIFTGETEQVDTFQFTQDSFSVTGTLVSTRAVTISATKVQPYEIDNTGKTAYVLYAQINGRYYALDGNGAPVQITVSGNELTLPAQNTTNLFWTFVDKPNDDGQYLYNPVQNEGTERYLHPYNGGVTTSGAWDVRLEVTDDNFKIRGNEDYRIRLTATAANLTTRSNEATNFYVARVNNYSGSYNVWFDGTLGGMMSYYGAADENRPVQAGENGQAVVELPETWQSTPKYDYVLRGWYDINTQQYYPVNPNDNVQPTATVSGDTVFYADWIAATYNVGQSDSHAVSSVDTSDFVTTYVFDYNVLFNVLSQSHTGTITSTGHSETWTIYNNGETVPYNDGSSLGFAFVDYDAGGDFSYANGRDNTNTNQSGITSGILREVRNNSGQDLLDLLFNPNTDVIGKYYAGTGNYLFQYMDSTTANYDGEHDGYYYLDARQNAASYNQSQQRFYLYDYLERTSDSRKDGGGGQYSDLLPFNSPYIFEGHQLDEYVDPILRPGYEYDAKDGASSYQEYNSADDATTNYFFGLRTDIEFFLPNATNTQDEYGNYGNISTRGEHMIFEFHGDDDVWVFVDGQLMLDIGGLHGIMHGQIDFSTGTISYGENADQNVSSFSLPAGTHNMTVYYMERGSSQSNCAIYFNIAPRYDLEITKEDIVTANKLDGAVFSVFDDEAMTIPSELWNSFEEHESGAATTNTFTVVNGVAKCWGISAGKTYYIYETTPPPGYPESDDMIRITLNNRGTATIETTTLHGENGVATEGFAVIKQDVNDTLKIVALTVTNQKEGDTTEIRVEKTWDEDSVSLPSYITVYLTADGQRIGRSARLTEDNGWSYTWTGLPKYRTEGIDEEIEYVVEEVFVPDYITVQGDSVKVENYVDWVRVSQMSDSNTFLLVHNGKALTYNGSFGWMDRTAAEAETSESAHWRVTTDHDGFHLKNELGYTLTYGTGGFYGIDNDAVALNQVFYYLNSRLMVHDHDVYYQFGTNGAVVQEDGLAFQLYQKEVLTGLLTNIINKPVNEELQTFVEVSKVWADGAENHVGDSVVIHLYADGKDTGRLLTLNAANNWSGSFDDLPYYQDGTDTKIAYTVVEAELNGYMPSYSESTVVAGRPISFWQNVDTLAASDAAHRIYAKGYSLAVDSSNAVVAIPNDLDDTSQQWKLVSRNGVLLLQNVATNRYLRVSNSQLSTTSQRSSGSAVTMTDGYITVGGQYLELGSGYASVTNSASNIDKDSLRITCWATSSGMNGVSYTVTNLAAFYELPNTGGAGTSLHTLGGLQLILTAACGYVFYTGRKRKKGGSGD